MAVLFGTQMTKIRVAPETPPDPGFMDGTKRSFNETVTLAAQATTDTIEVARLPKGAVVTGARIISDTAFGVTATIAIGITGTTGKYRAAATFNVADTWEELALTTTFHAALAAEEIVFVTIAAAALPASGTFLVQFDYAFN